MADEAEVRAWLARHPSTRIAVIHRLGGLNNDAVARVLAGAARRARERARYEAMLAAEVARRRAEAIERGGDE
jgi:hypothetical protein